MKKASLSKFKSRKTKINGVLVKLFPAISFILLVVILCFFSLVIRTNEEKEEKVLGKTTSFKDLLPTPALYPFYKNSVVFPQLTANSVKIIDVDSFATLYEKNPQQRVFPASTTKIMTALVALDEYPLDGIITVNNNEVDGNAINLALNEKLTVENLLYGLLVGSGNDAALVLAENYQFGFLGFVDLMNQKASQLHLDNTRFTNPMGFDQEGHYSTAEDLVRLAVFAMKNPIFARIVSSGEYIITDITGSKEHFLKNTNELIGKVDGVKGVKTGWTENAGECLISFVEKDNHRLVYVLLGSKDRFRETINIIDWAFASFDWRKIYSYRF